MALEFPFADLTPLQVAFSGIDNKDEVIEACPEEFYDQNEMSDLAMAMFFHGTANMGAVQEKYVVMADSVEEGQAKARNIEAWAKNFSISHQDKQAVCGWLLSLMLHEKTQE